MLLQLVYCYFICWYSIQTAYDKSKAGKRVRDNVVPLLAWWHTYKTSLFLLFKEYAKTVFAGLHHSLFPTNIFFVKPSYLTNILLLFQYTRLAYPEFKGDLITALSKNDLSPAVRSYLLNLQSLCEFFIPVVIYILLLFIDYQPCAPITSHNDVRIFIKCHSYHFDLLIILVFLLSNSSCCIRSICILK